MTYEEYPPESKFSKYIECIWILKGCGDENDFIQEALVPGGRSEIVFTDSTFLWYGEKAKSIPAPVKGSFLLGPRKSANFIGLSGHYNCIGIRFRIGCLSCFMNSSSRHYANKIIPLSQVFDPLTLPRDLLLTDNIPEMLSSINRWLEQRFSPPDSNWEIVQDLIREYFTNEDEKFSVKELSRKYSWNYKQTERMFLKHTGFPPRTIIKIMRFRKIMDNLKLNPENMTSSAHRFGFYDQSHFIKEFHNFTGTNPTSFYKNLPGIASLLYRLSP